MDKRTLDNLRNNLVGRIYITFGNMNDYHVFMQNAEAEGYFIGSKKPTEISHCPDIVSLNEGKRLCYCGFVDHMAFKLDNSAYRVDYGKFVAGEDDYLY